MKTKYDWITKEFLEEQVYKLGKSLSQVARENDISEGSIFYLAKYVGFKNRTIEEANKHCFSKGINKEILIKKYVNENKSILTISYELKISQSLVFRYLKRFGIETKQRGKCYKVWNEGKHYHTDKSKKCLDCGKVIRQENTRCQECFSKNYDRSKINYYWLPKGENHPSWKGGKSFEPYSSDWRRSFRKDFVENRGNFCELCGKTKEQNITNMDVHHIDYNKKNCSKDNLVMLCKGCHSKTNHSRFFWEHYFKEVHSYYKFN